MCAKVFVGCLTGLLLAAAPALADKSPPKAPHAVSPALELALAADVAAVAASDLEAIEARARLRPLDGPANPDPRLSKLRFRDHLSPALWLRNVKSLPLVTFWQTNRMSIFLGLNSKGLPGLHVQQTEPEHYDATTFVVTDEVPTDLPVRSLALASR